MRGPALTEMVEARIVHIIRSITPALLHQKMQHHQRTKVHGEGNAEEKNSEGERSSATIESDKKNKGLLLEVDIDAFSVVLADLRASLSPVQTQQLFCKIDKQRRSCVTCD